MTGKEIVLKALRFEKTERLPVAILDGYVWILKRAGKSFQDLIEMEEGGAEFIADSFNLLQSDIVYTNAHAINALFQVMGGEICLNHPGEAAEVIKRPLEKIGDIKKYQVENVIDQMFATPIYKAEVELTKGLVKRFGNEKLIPALSFAPFSLASMLTGVQGFMESLYEEDHIELLLDFVTEVVIKNVKLHLDLGANAVFFADPVASGDLISPSCFETFVLPIIKNMCSELKNYDVPILFHICGNTESRLAPLIDSGIHGFSLDSVDLRKSLDTAKGHYTIIGNMSPSGIILSKTPKEIKKICTSLAKTAGNGGGYIMMPGCDLPPDAPLENILAMVDAAHNIE